MPNDLTKNPWILDTAAVTVLTTMGLRPKSVRWVGAVAAGDAAVLKDRNGRIVWESRAPGSNTPETELISGEMDTGVNWDGLICATLGSGKLYLSLR